MKTATELYNRIVSHLGLQDRSITFHIINYDGPMDGGMITDADRLETSDAFADYADAFSGSETLDIDCTSFMIGTGESDAATGDDMKILYQSRAMFPRLFSDMLTDYADIPAEFSATVPNPYYEPDDDDM